MKRPSPLVQVFNKLLCSDGHVALSPVSLILQCIIKAFFVKCNIWLAICDV
ncbi:hypothetical protein KsCSTR_06170 [Candidatus Kuenenia stuttgartiensis]|uniref:Uncharacterized protein n=1 Tax=Kuenenia stuttgartiensis TaxID=174633 RepID=Q1PZW8_KUEST|nr:hypothetical protein KsCSTR_06170 [Candidatus Kuenenia stuttgartiensis]CAJ72626.1 unknown protein [Candidatus Kuenenia stuttgartiensis]